MKRISTYRWLRFGLALMSAAMLLTALTAALTFHPVAARPLGDDAPGTVLQVFDNAWMNQNSLGLVYDPDRGIVRYAHESQSSAKRPTIFDVDPVKHTAVVSIALSAKNSGWRWQIDNRDGAGYDYAAGTYFLPDYNGDLSYADDNIVEIDAAGKILNAWEMDNEVGSNDSADGSRIDTIIDIAVVPGNPNRYFVAAAYDSNRVYEIALTRTGKLWTPNSWSTLAKCSVPGLTDNLGIDYDAQYNRLYHSDWKSNKIIVTDLACEDGQPMNVLYEFTCPGAGGYNSGVTFIEGADPPEIWVTDFNKNKTTRCVAVGAPSPAPDWEKTVAGEPWAAGLTITTQTADTFVVSEVITAGRPFTLTELWDAERLELLTAQVEPSLADIITATGALTITGSEATPEVVTVTKQFLALPSTWTATVVSETLDIEAGDGYGAFSAQKHFTVAKRAPALHIAADVGQPEVYAGSVAQFTLAYSNTGGFENSVIITGTFPVTAPFLYADPEPDATAADRSWARWAVGDLADGASGQISVYVYVAEVAGAGEAVTITNRIYNHVGAVADEAEAAFEVIGAASAGWTKTIDSGGGPVAWSPTFSLTLETGNVFTVTDVLTVNEAFTLTETWLPSELALKSWAVTPAAYTPLVNALLPGFLSLNAPAMSGLYPRPITLTKVFTVNTCSWPLTLLLETLQIGTSRPAIRPVLIHKDAPILALTAAPPIAEAHGGETVTYKLTYANTGGFEDEFTVRAGFPAQASFQSADPAPTSSAGGVVTWAFTDGLGTGESGMITVTARIADEVPPATWVVITNTLLDHADVPKAVALVAYEIEPPEWEKRVNGGAWDAPLLVVAGDEFIVTEVVTSETAFTLMDRWVDDHLTLLEATPDKGTVVSSSGRITWTVPARSGPAALTKRFRAEAFTTAYTVLWEDLAVGGAEWERRAVLLERAIPELQLTKTATPEVAQPGDPVTYTLTFSNTGAGAAQGVLLTDTIPISVTGTAVASSVVITQLGGTRYVWEVADLPPGARGVITITGVLSDSLPTGLLTNEAEIAATNGAQVGGSSPGEDTRITAAATIAVDGAPLVCTLAINDPTTYAFCNGICGQVAFTDTGTVSSLAITFTQRFPSINGEGLPRQYLIEPNGGGYEARLTLCYEDEELALAGIPASDEPQLRGFRHAGGGLWQAPAAQTVNIGGNTVTIEGVTEFSAWGIGIPDEAQPTAVRQLGHLTGSSTLIGPGGVIVLALGLAGLAAWARKRSRRLDARQRGVFRPGKEA